MRFKYTDKNVSENGYCTERRVYEAEDCQDCSLRTLCMRKKQGKRIWSFSVTGQAWRDQARQNLTSSVGQSLRVRRRTEAETVFGCIKGNWSFRRFLLRGLQKVETEWGLICTAHNLARMVTVAG